jgi:hypothetical protein
MSNFIKILSLGAKWFHADRRTDGRTDITKLIVAIRNFANAPTKPALTVPFLVFVGVNQKEKSFSLITLQKLTTHLQSLLTVISILTFSCSCVGPLRTSATLHPIHNVAQYRLFHRSREFSFQAPFPLTFCLFVCWLFVCLTVPRGIFLFRLLVSSLTHS